MYKSIDEFTKIKNAFNVSQSILNVAIEEAVINLLKVVIDYSRKAMEDIVRIKEELKEFEDV